MSISGLHVTLVSGLCAWLVRRLWRRVPRPRAAPARAQGRRAGRDRRRARLHAARRLRGAGAAHLLHGDAWWRSRCGRGASPRPRARSRSRSRVVTRARSLGGAAGRVLAVVRRGGADLLRVGGLDRARGARAAVAARAMGDHGGPRARGAVPLLAGVGRRAARQRGGDPARVGGDHAARARSPRCCRWDALLHLAEWLTQWLLEYPRLVRVAAGGGLAAARAAALGDAARARGRRLAARAARLSLARDSASR